MQKLQICFVAFNLIFEVERSRLSEILLQNCLYFWMQIFWILVFDWVLENLLVNTDEGRFFDAVLHGLKLKFNTLERKWVLGMKEILFQYFFVNFGQGWCHYVIDEFNVVVNTDNAVWFENRVDDRG